ncbi:hypothetical protein [Halarchaeum sp. P4]|uniref:hypothetical protein n=1 Tax=Halarchaeum sp. P4 TaxID=3421639 RepID=UPI003EB84ACC
MSRPETVQVFAGIDDRAAAVLPEWYATRVGDDEVVSFAEAVRSLPRAVASDVAYRNPYTGAWEPTERFTALVDPERVAARARGEDVDALFHVPTAHYSIITPLDVYGPLETAVAEETVDGRALGDVVFGEIRQYRGGGEVHMDVLFDGLSVTLPGRDDPIAVGFSSGYDFFGGHAVYVEGYAQDAYCANSIRRLTERQTVKHVGDIANFETWWECLLARLAVVADDLAAFIHDAQDVTLDLREVPFDLVDFYTLLDLPEYLAQRAASDARGEADDPFEMDMWTLHSGATYALTHHYTGKEGASLDTYVRIANDILFNPQVTLARLVRAYKRRADAETSADGQTGLGSQTALAQVERVEQDLGAKVARFESREARLRERFAQTE